MPELCRQHGMSSASLYKWQSKYGGMDASMMTRIKNVGRGEPSVQEDVLGGEAEGRDHFGGDVKKVVRKMCQFAAPPGYRRTPVLIFRTLEPLLAIIDAILAADKQVHVKQRHQAVLVKGTFDWFNIYLVGKLKTFGIGPGDHSIG